MEGLNDFEQAVLEKLLAGDDPTLGVLRHQAHKARLASREYTGVGFFCEFEIPSDVPALVGPTEFDIGDVNASMDGLEFGAGFVLFVRDGRLAMLEGYTYDEPWPDEVRSLELTYQTEPRDLGLS